MAENENSERNTHFLGFAEQVYEALAQNVVLSKHRRLSEIEVFKQEQHTIIAQFAYDLAVHAICAYDETPRDFAIEMIEHIPDLTNWPDTSEQ